MHSGERLDGPSSRSNEMGSSTRMKVEKAYSVVMGLVFFLYCLSASIVQALIMLSGF